MIASMSLTGSRQAGRFSKKASSWSGNGEVFGGSGGSVPAELITDATGLDALEFPFPIQQVCSALVAQSWYNRHRQNCDNFGDTFRMHLVQIYRCYVSELHYWLAEIGQFFIWGMLRKFNFGHGAPLGWCDSSHWSCRQYSCAPEGPQQPNCKPRPRFNMSSRVHIPRNLSSSYPTSSQILTILWGASERLHLSPLSKPNYSYKCRGISKLWWVLWYFLVLVVIIWYHILI